MVIPQSTSMTHVREINDPAELESLRPSWDALLARTPGATYCQTLDWLTAFWNHYGAGKRLRVLAVYDRSQVVGILPLAVWAARRSEPKSLTYALDYWSETYGPIGPDREATLSAGLEHLGRTPRDWHFIELPSVDALVDAGCTKRALDAAGFRAICDRVDENAVVELTAFNSWNEYCAAHSSKWRNDIKRQEKKLAREGRVTYLRCRRAGAKGAELEPRWDLFEACEAISKASWQGRAPGGTMLTKEADRGFFRECFQKAGHDGGVDLDLLFVDDQPVAFSYSYYYRGRVAQIKTAFDPRFAHEGAGAVLQARCIAESFARGDHAIEMGHEFLHWKRMWLTHLRPVHRYVHFPLSPAAQLIRGKRALVRRLRPWIRRWRAQAEPLAQKLPAMAEEQPAAAP
jgi:CelD/BcsL family acetyltransferase involved in cellulose biosynthesis